MAKRYRREWLTELAESYVAKGIEVSEDLLLLLVKDQILLPHKIRDHLIWNDYHELLAKNDGHSLRTVYELAIKYGVSERQVQNLLYNRMKSIRKRKADH